MPGFATLLANLSPTKRAWLAVAGAWLVQAATVGPINAYGAYQAIYWNNYIPGVTASALSWIGSLQIFFEFSVAIAGGILLDAGYFKETLLGGSCLFTFSYFMLSLVREGMFVPALLAQGIGMGVGLGLLFLPISGVVAQHFPTSRNLPLGIISTGAGFGGFGISLLTSTLYGGDSLSFGWTVRVAAFIVLACLFVANILITEVPRAQRAAPQKFIKGRQSQQEEQAGEESSSPPSIDLDEAVASQPCKTSIKRPGGVSSLVASLREVLSSPVYLLTVAGGTLFVMGIFYPAYSLESFALYNGVDSDLASWLLPMANLSSLIGRVLPAYAADRIPGRFGAHNMFSLCAVCAGALTIAMPACTSSGALIAFSILYGLFQGAGPGLFFPTILALGGSRPGFRLGLASVPMSIGALVGSPIASALLGPTTDAIGSDGQVVRSNPQWWRGAGFAAAVWFASALSMAAAMLLAQWHSRRAKIGVDRAEGRRVDAEDGRPISREKTT